MSCLQRCSTTAQLDPQFSPCRLCSVSPPKCPQLVIMWPRSFVTVFALPVAPQMFRCRGGGLSRANSVGRPPCTPSMAVCDLSLHICVLLGGCRISVGCYRLPPTVLATSRHQLLQTYTTVLFQHPSKPIKVIHFATGLRLEYY